jgi:hypothetical protein
MGDPPSADGENAINSLVRGCFWLDELVRNLGYGRETALRLHCAPATPGVLELLRANQATWGKCRMQRRSGAGAGV